MAKRTQQLDLPSEIAEVAQSAAPVAEKAPEVTPCLLYTSDAADE